MVDPVVALVIAVDDERHDVDLDLDELPVGAHPAGQPVRAPVLQRLADDRLAFVRVLGRLDHERVDRAADGILRRVAEQPLGRRVPAGHHLVPIHRDDGDRTDVHERLEVLLLRADLLEQPRGLDRDRRLLRETDEEVEILVREELGRRRSPDGHHPDDPTASQERSRHQAFFVLLPRARDADGPRIAREIVHDLGGAAARQVADHTLADADRVGHDQLGHFADRHEGEVPIRTRTLLQEDRARVGLQQVLRPFADPSDHRVEFEQTTYLTSQLGKRGHLAPAALRLVEQPHVLQRDAQARGERVQEAGVGLGERVLPIEVLERDPPGRFAAHDERHEQHRLRRLARADDGTLAEPEGTLLRCVVDHQGFAGFDDVTAQAVTHSEVNGSSG